ncbi:phosphoadenosine phosphosulfate reductase domain-containing protein [Paenibacillus xanthanilyticus]|uniref:Phosphoadenosine phosphosulfate reductase family protein n=1 Tax=Paenibacillus xanthanilyticus TaxID=1783531 RepID=A0ABV8KA43_9BACL
MNKPTVNILSVSGGKDSTAMWLLAIEKGVKVEPVFADTGNEHPMTYEYLDYLERELGTIRRVKADFSRRIAKRKEYVVTHWPSKLQKDVPGQWIKISDEEDLVPPAFEPPDPYKPYNGVAGWRWEPTVKGMTPEETEVIVQRALTALVPSGNPFLDLCIWKGRFPSTKARFCTTFLKTDVIYEQVVMPYLEQGFKVVSWQGVRAEESHTRSKLPEREETPEGQEVYRPILRWLVDDVFAIHDRMGVKPNPLYKLGMSRVGCMPCVNCNKGELFEISRRFPAEIDRIREWEAIVKQASKRGAATFFPTAHGQGNGIDEWVEWSKTTHGGKNMDLLKAIELADDPPMCSSVYGLCE